MKTLTILISIVAATMVTTISRAADADSSRYEKKIIKTVELTDDGKMIIDSTFISKDGENTLLVDTIFVDFDRPGPGPGFKQMAKQMRRITDEMDHDFNMEFGFDNDSTDIMAFDFPQCFGNKMNFNNRDSRVPLHKWMMIQHNDNDRLQPPMPPKFHQKGLIDLNDPSVISFEKSTQKDGTEKIVIIRKKEKE